MNNFCFLTERDYELIYFKEYISTFDEIKKKSKKCSKILLHFKDIKVNSQILGYLLNYFRYAQNNSFNIYYIIKEYDNLNISDFKAYFSIFESIEEYNKMKAYSNFEVKIYDDNPYFKNILKSELLKFGFKIKDRTSLNFLNKDHDCKYNSIYIIDFDNLKNEKIKEVEKIRKVSSDCIIIGLISNENDISSLEYITFGISYIFKKPLNYNEFLIYIKNIAYSINLNIENEKLINTIVEREKEISKLYNNLNNELKLASDIQKSLMPKEEINFKNYTINCIYKPSMNVGGDFYDFITLSENRFAIVFADISGHGIASSLLASMLKVLIYNHAKKVKSIVELMDILNEEIINIFPKGKFVSLFYLVVDTKMNNIRYCSASQEPAIMHNTKTNSINILKTKGQVLGLFSKKVFPNISFEEKTIEFNIDHSVLLYTDGVTEAKDINDNYYGFDRLIENIKKDDIYIIEKDLKNFVDNKAFEDDVTLLKIQRTY